MAMYGRRYGKGMAESMAKYNSMRYCLNKYDNLLEKYGKIWAYMTSRMSCSSWIMHAVKGLRFIWQGMAQFTIV